MSVRPIIEHLQSPAIAIRLLDFPAIVISGGKDGSSDTNGVENRSIHFGKGKNCLFKIEEKRLTSLLSHIPLYVMLMDLQPSMETQEPGCSSLIGTTAIDLSAYAGSICLPESGGRKGYRRGYFPLLDLMV